jgi:hypothetical protein
LPLRLLPLLLPPLLLPPLLLPLLLRFFFLLFFFFFLLLFFFTFFFLFFFLLFLFLRVALERSRAQQLPSRAERRALTVDAPKLLVFYFGFNIRTAKLLDSGGRKINPKMVFPKTLFLGLGSPFLNLFSSPKAKSLVARILNPKY